MTLFVRKILTPVAFLASLMPLSVAAQQLNPIAKNNQQWTVSPFDSKVFIENRGQFNNEVESKDKILYSVKLGDVNMYFTASGIVYKYDELVKDKNAEQKQPVSQYLTTEWENSSPNVTVSAEQEVAYYFTYPDGRNKTI